MQAVPIKLNEEALALEASGDTSVAALLQEIKRDHIQRDHVVSAVVINGVIWEHEHDEELQHLRRDQIEELAVYTQTTESVASEGLRDLQLMMTMIQDHTDQAIVEVRKNNIAEGVMLFLKGADMLHDVLYFLRLYIQNKEISAKVQRDYQRITEELTKALLTFEGAQQKQDWTLVADLMHYEFKARLEELAQLGASLRAQEEKTS